jgi:hypothetical protein
MLTKIQFSIFCRLFYLKIHRLKVIRILPVLLYGYETDSHIKAGSAYLRQLKRRLHTAMVRVRWQVMY